MMIFPYSIDTFGYDIVREKIKTLEEENRRLSQEIRRLKKELKKKIRSNEEYSRRTGNDDNPLQKEI